MNLFRFVPGYETSVYEAGRGKIWWFEVPWFWRFPLDYQAGIALSLGLAGLSAWAAGDAEPLRRHLWMLAGLELLVALTVLAAPLHHRWYRRMRRPGADDRDAVRTYPPSAPGQAWAGGAPDLHLDHEGRAR